MSYRSSFENSVKIMSIGRKFMMIESNTFSDKRWMVKYQQKKKDINGFALDKMVVF
jgi:hypothetical protein